MTNDSDYKSPFGLKKQMGYTRKEFFNILPELLSNYSFVSGVNEVLIEISPGKVLIKIGAEQVRRFTKHVSFPILPVEIQFEGLDDGKQNHFLRQFDRLYMKGLG